MSCVCGCADPLALAGILSISDPVASHRQCSPWSQSSPEKEQRLAPSSDMERAVRPSCQRLFPGSATNDGSHAPTIQGNIYIYSFFAYIHIHMCMRATFHNMLAEIA